MADERLVRIAEIEVDPDQLDAYLAFLTEEISSSIGTEPGVLMLHAVADKSAPHQIRILEVYACRAAYEAHIQTPHFIKYKHGTADMVTVLRLIDMDPIILAAQ